MSSSHLRFLFCVGLAAGLAGCGGSSTSSSSGGGGQSNPTIVTYTFVNSGGGGTPTALATQIGTGAFTPATLSSGKLTITVPSGETNYSVAYLCPPYAGINPPSYNEYINRASTLDGTSFGGYCFGPATASSGIATLEVNAAAITGGSSVGLGYTDLPWSSSTLDFSSQLFDGTYDVPVTVYNLNRFNEDDYLAVKILRSQTIPGALNNGEPVVFTASDKVVTEPVTYTNIPSGYTLEAPYAAFMSSGGAQVILQQTLGAGATNQIPELPPGAIQTGDYYSIAGAAYATTNNGFLGIQEFETSNGPVSLALPAAWSFSGPTPAALPTFNFDYSGFAGMSGVTQNADVTWVAANASSISSISMYATQNYQNGSASLTIPDLSGLTGFLAPPPSGALVQWSAELLQGYTFSLNTTAKPIGPIQFVETNGTYTAP